MNKVLAFIIVGIALALSGCSDAAKARFGAMGESGHITCYSGGKVIYEGTSTGMIKTEEQSDGWYLNDAATNKLVRVSGDCVIQYK